jgi:hypothetical protein
MIELDLLIIDMSTKWTVLWVHKAEKLRQEFVFGHCEMTFACFTNVFLNVIDKRLNGLDLKL